VLTRPCVAFWFTCTEWATAAAKMPYSAFPSAHDPEKCARFSDKIMRKIKEIEHDPFRQERIVL
jgi:hypothetical protein